MRRTAIVFSLISLLGMGCLQPEQQEESTVTILLPPGDPADGKRAFVKLSCFACHIVKNHSDLPDPWSRAPSKNVELGGVAPAPSRDELVNGIFSSTHWLAPELEKFLGREMPDYSNAMTVKQLTDLVAFLQTSYE